MRDGPKTRLSGEPLDLRWLGRDRGARVIRFTQRFARLTKGPRAGELVKLKAANEVLTNAVQYANGLTAVWAWVADDGRFICQIEDRGQGVADPLAGYRSPRDDLLAGRGLWLARQLVDLLQIVPGPSGTAVRLQVNLWVDRQPLPIARNPGFD